MARAVPGEAGFTLIELAVTITVLGVAFGVFVGGMGTSILASDYHARQATAETALRRGAETLKSRTTPYVNCTTGSTGARPYLLPDSPTGYTSSITAVAFWDGDTASTAGGSFGAAPGSCPLSDNGLQRLTIRVADATGRESESVQIVKRRRP